MTLIGLWHQRLADLGLGGGGDVFLQQPGDVVVEPLLGSPTSQLVTVALTGRPEIGIPSFTNGQAATITAKAGTPSDVTAQALRTWE